MPKKSAVKNTPKKAKQPQSAKANVESNSVSKRRWLLLTSLKLALVCLI